MKLIVKDGSPFASHADDQQVEGLYPGCTVMWAPDGYKPFDETGRPNPLPVVDPLVSYAELRRAEYPPITDYLDGLVKGDQAQVNAYLQACLDIKLKYPKPSL